MPKFLYGVATFPNKSFKKPPTDCCGALLRLAAGEGILLTAIGNDAHAIFLNIDSVLLGAVPTVQCAKSSSAQSAFMTAV